MRILLIDDDVFLRDMYATKFTEANHEVSSVDQADKAVQLLENGESFDVILVDMVMPGMSGVEFLQQVQNNGLCGGAVCVVLSNQGQKSDIDEATAAGAHDYIIKAENIPSEVVEKVEKILANTKQQ